MAKSSTNHTKGANLEATSGMDKFIFIIEVQTIFKFSIEDEDEYEISWNFNFWLEPKHSIEDSLDKICQNIKISWLYLKKAF